MRHIPLILFRKKKCSLIRNPTIFNIICWVSWSLVQSTHGQASDVPSIIFFFHNFLQNSFQKLLQFVFLFFYVFTVYKKLWKEIILAWNIRRLVFESFVPLTQRASVLYWRLSDFLFIFVELEESKIGIWSK